MPTQTSQFTTRPKLNIEGSSSSRLLKRASLAACPGIRTGELGFEKALALAMRSVHVSGPTRMGFPVLLVVLPKSSIRKRIAVHVLVFLVSVAERNVDERNIRP